MPAREEFVEVVCEDVCAGGISFYLAAAPEFTDLVVVLRKPPLLTHVTAHVLHVVEKTIGGKKLYLVACRFTGRATLYRHNLCHCSPGTLRGDATY
jgi:hypothetical protein